jgi:DNA-binding CsgD family transcriptional regulator
MNVETTASFAIIGRCAASIATDKFYPRLLEILTESIRHDMAMVMRYPRFAAPDFLTSTGFSKELMDIYLVGFYRFDPFYRYWRTEGKCGLIPLETAIAPSVRKTDYLRIFQPMAKIEDELAVFLPGAGGSSIALFVERSEGKFTAAEKERVQEIYPVLAGLHDAHLRSIFASLGTNITGTTQQSRPTMIVDRNGLRVHADKAWMEIEHRQPGLKDALKRLELEAKKQISRPDGTILHMEQLPCDFPLAPGGRIFMLEEPGLHPIAEAAPSDYLPFESSLTHREAQIVELVLQGFPTFEIARRLKISIGTVKNHRRRLYHKLDITTERELFLLYLQSLARSKPAADRDIASSIVSRRNDCAS